MTTKTASQSITGEISSYKQRWCGRLRRHYPLVLVALAGFLVGILWLGAVRFLIVQPGETHYHANFAVYINGQREEFSSFAYYEEIAACGTAYANNPKGRAHMHDNINDVIHVHDKRVTYADFFENIGWNLGPDFIHTDTTLYSNNDQSKMMFMLNGKPVERVDNLVIGDKDRLLVSYGPADTDLSAQFKTISSSAAEVDETQDPASCSGLNGPGDDGFVARLKRATFWE